MERGILLELKGRQAVVLTPRGEFLKVVAENTWQIGEEVAFHRPAQAPGLPVWRRNWVRYAAGLAAALLLALGLGLYQGLSVEAAVATVTVDINPSLQLQVSARGNVVGAMALNADGQRILQDLSYRRRPVDDVVAEITDLAVKDGFLDPNAEDALVVISAQAVQGKAAPAGLVTELNHARQKAEEKIKKHATGEVNLNWAVVEGSAELQKLARDQRISEGKAAVLKTLEEMGMKVDPEELRKSVKEVIRDEARKQGLPPGQLRSELQKQLNALGFNQGDDKGDKGDKGQQGDRGRQGDKGQQGDRGRQGDKGDKPDKGDKGDRSRDNPGDRSRDNPGDTSRDRSGGPPRPPGNDDKKPPEDRGHSDREHPDRGDRARNKDQAGSSSQGSGQVYVALGGIGAGSPGTDRPGQRAANAAGHGQGQQVTNPEQGEKGMGEGGSDAGNSGRDKPDRSSSGQRSGSRGDEKHHNGSGRP